MMPIENELEFQYLIEEVCKAGFKRDKQLNSKQLYVFTNEGNYAGYKVVLDKHSMLYDIFYQDNSILDPALGAE